MLRLQQRFRNKALNVMITFDKVTVENSQEHYRHWPRVPDHSYRILIAGGSGSGNMNAILNLLHH